MKLTPITNPVALRRDTTVGTRIFAGDTMIHGDTGYVNLIPSDRWAASLASSRLAITRVGNIVEIEGRISPAGQTVGSARTGLSSIVDIPLGFRPRNAPGGGSRHSAGQAYILVGAGVGEAGTLLFAEGQGLSIRMTPPTTNVWASTDHALVHAVWRTPDPWPTSLP